MRCVFVILLGICLVLPGFADEVKLKGQGVITGKVLAEKETIVAVDVGYTVLVIPREQVESIARGVADRPVKPAARLQKGLYRVAVKPPLTTPKEAFRNFVINLTMQVCPVMSCISG